MARVRSPDRDKAFKIYKKHKGNIDLVKIADILNISPGTIRGWKNKDKWNDKLNGTFQKENVKDKERSNKKNKVIKKPIAEEVKEVLENAELTDKQRFFCVLYAKRQNATKAYQKVYRCTYETAMVNGNKLLRNTKIREQLERLLEAELNKEFLKKGLIQQYKDIAFSNIGDYLEFGKKQVPQWTKSKDGEDIPIIDPNTGEQKIIEYSYVDLKDSISLDTSIITEVFQGKDGIKFKLADKMKAMEVLSKLSNLLSDEEKTKLQIENMRYQNTKLQAETEKIKGKDKDESINIVIKRKERED